MEGKEEIYELRKVDLDDFPDRVERLAKQGVGTHFNLPNSHEGRAAVLKAFRRLMPLMGPDSAFTGIEVSKATTVGPQQDDIIKFRVVGSEGSLHEPLPPSGPTETPSE